jgi:Rrf2 family protein
MTVGKSARYALHAAMGLARAGPGGQVTSVEIAERYGIPPAVMAKIFQKLVRRGLVVGTSGPRGGYRLARKASSITVLDVLDAFEPARAPDPSGHVADGRPRRVVDEINELARGALASVALDTLVGRGASAARPRRMPQGTNSVGSRGPGPRGPC